jgi:hypothetical protein
MQKKSINFCCKRIPFVQNTVFPPAGTPKSTKVKGTSIKERLVHRWLEDGSAPATADQEGGGENDGQEGKVEDCWAESSFASQTFANKVFLYKRI